MASFDAQQLLTLAPALTVERGQEYFFHNRISKIVCQGDRYRAEVKGSSPYVTYLWASPLSGRCNCPYGGKGACKHIIALGMAILAGSPAAEPWEESVPQGETPPLRYLSKLNPLDWSGHAQTDTLLEEMDSVLGAYFAGEAVDLAGFAERLAEETIAPFWALDMMRHFFEVWQKVLRRTESRGEDLVIDWEGWGKVLTALARDKMGRRFLDIRIDAYSLADTLGKTLS